MTDRLGTLNNLYSLFLKNCSLTHLPNLRALPYLTVVVLAKNHFSSINGLTSVSFLDLNDNLFNDIPTLNIPKNLHYLYMKNNPIKNILSITSHVNLQTLHLQNTTLSSIPATIDRLRNLDTLDLSNNKLFFLPTNILNMHKLKYLNIQNNSFSSSAIKIFKTEFKTSHPDMTLLT